jgi:ATP-binding cassette subfamily B multidrug efflux pump
MLLAAQRAEASGFIGQLTDLQGRTGFDAQVGERGVAYRASSASVRLRG